MARTDIDKAKSKLNKEAKSKLNVEPLAKLASAYDGFLRRHNIHISQNLTERIASNWFWI